MPIRISSTQLVDVTGGTARDSGAEAVVASGLEMDCRNVRGGELFVALAGEHSHGHRYVIEAFRRGAALFLVESFEECLKACPQEEERQLLLENQGRFVEVEDSLVSFGVIAQWWQRRRGLPIAAVTGSMGKTITKELLAVILLGDGPGAYSRKSYNNHTGVPYSLSQISDSHEWGVFEVGMNHAGEITNLAALIEPQVAVITCVAPVHMEFFNSLDEVADAKAELAASLPAGGVLVSLGDDAPLQAAIDRVCEARPAHDIKRITFGSAADNDAVLGPIAHSLEKGLCFSLTFGGETVTVTMPLLGPHNAYNATAALVAAKSMKTNVPLQELADRLISVVPPPGRLETVRLATGQNIVNDAYNANPQAMEALFKIGTEFKNTNKRVGYVLGDMLELGDAAEKLHRQVAESVAATAPEFVVGVGEFAELFATAAKAAGVPGFTAPTPEAAAHLAEKMPFDVCLIKASRGVALDKTVTRLVERLGEAVPPPQFFNGAAAGENG